MSETTVLLKNQYYPKGLTELLVNRHYTKNKRAIVNEVKNRNIVMFLYVDENKYTVVRNIKGKPTTLTMSNWDEVMNPRVVSVSVEMPFMTNYWLIDIDVGVGFPESKTKKAVTDLKEFFSQECKDIVNSFKVTSSSNSFHVYAILKDRIELLSAKRDTKSRMKRFFGSRYKIDERGKGRIPNFDLSSMKKRGSHTVAGALNLNGTCCIYIDDVHRFRKSTTVLR